jgi:hypothetical protein
MTDVRKSESRVSERFLFCATKTDVGWAFDYFIWRGEFASIVDLNRQKGRMTRFTFFGRSDHPSAKVDWTDGG